VDRKFVYSGWEDNSETDLAKMWYKGQEWVEMAQ
jgi:hypothetical protein